MRYIFTYIHISAVAHLNSQSNIFFVSVSKMPVLLLLRWAVIPAFSYQKIKINEYAYGRRSLETHLLFANMSANF